MENTNRHIFSLSGITGMLIATVLLLSILGVLTVWGIKAQQDVMQKPYNLTNQSVISKKSSIDEQNRIMIIKE